MSNRPLRGACGWRSAAVGCRDQLIGWLAGSRWALTVAKWGAVGLTVLLFLLLVRRAGERAGRLAQRLETLEKSNDVQRWMLAAAARRPRTREELARRLRDGRF